MTPDPEAWLRTALALWSGPGIDAATGTAWEALDHTGRPLTGLDRRMRVQLRQAYVFAKCGDPALLPRAHTLFDHIIGHGFDPDTGYLASLVAPDLTIRTAPHALYDLAFAALATAALIDATAPAGVADRVGAGDGLARVEAALNTLNAPRGWHETATRSLPRRQNPHMHLFEASTELLAATGAPRFAVMARTCLDLLRDVFLQPDGRILEYYTADWQPLSGSEQAVEPGHMAEWIYLIDRFETVTGTGTGVDMARLWQAVTARLDDGGFLPDHSDPPAPTRRLWPQTELLKAACVMERHGHALPAHLRPAAIWARVAADYLNPEVPGGWFDRRDSAGRLISDRMPASSLYHLFDALRLYTGQNAR